MLALGLLGTGGETDAVISHVIKKRPPVAAQGVCDLCGEAAGEDTGVLPFLNVLAPPLDEMTGEFVAERSALFFILAQC